MDRPLLPGEYATLALLLSGPMHGYEMARFFHSQEMMEVCPLEQSSLYTYLRTLEGRGLVEWQEDRVGLRPPRKTFALTSDGRDLVESWLHTPVTRMREVRLDLLLKVFFLHRLDRAAEIVLLKDQITACERYLAQIEARRPQTEFSALVARSKRSAAEATLSWLRAYARELEQGVSS